MAGQPIRRREGLTDKQRCESKFQSEHRGIVRCTKRVGHQAHAWSQKHTSERSGYEVSWDDEQAYREDAA